MSTTYRFPTLDVDALRSLTDAGVPEKQNWREQQNAIQDNLCNDIHETLRRENVRLCTENEKLRHCLVLTKENGDLKSANYATSSMTWCDDKLRYYMADVLQMDKSRDKQQRKYSRSASDPSGTANGRNISGDKTRYDAEDQLDLGYPQSSRKHKSPCLKLDPDQYRQFGPSPNATASLEQWKPKQAFSQSPVSRTPQSTYRGPPVPTELDQDGLLELQQGRRNGTPVGLSTNGHLQSTGRATSSKNQPWKPWKAGQQSAGQPSSQSRATPQMRASSAGTSRNGSLTFRPTAFSTLNPRATRQWTPTSETGTLEVTPRYINAASSATPRPGPVYTSQYMKDLSRNYNAIGQPIAQSTPVRGRNMHSSTTNYDGQAQYNASPHLGQHPDSLAVLLGIRGRGSKEKAKSVVYRPVDSITGYQPTLTIEQTSQLWMSKPNRRLVGEIAFQLDRRILEHIFSGIGKRASKTKNARYYGYSLTNVMQMIKKESRINGAPNAQMELQLRERLLKLLHRLSPIGYVLELHAEVSQDMVNKHGLLNGPPDQQTMEYFGLESPAILRILVGQVLKEDEERNDMLVLLDCLCFLAHEDNGPLFMW